LPWKSWGTAHDTLNPEAFRATLRDPGGFGHIGSMIPAFSGSDVPWRAVCRPAFSTLEIGRVVQ
jgi:hypothetical protein